MKNKKIIITVIIIILVALGGGIYLYISSQGADSGGDGSGDNPFGFLPFGLFGSGSRDNDFDMLDDDMDTDTSDDMVSSRNRLRQLGLESVAGIAVFTNGSNNDVSIKYIERATGHIFEIEQNNPQPSRISNTTIPHIQEAIWRDENNLFIRYLSSDGETIETYSAQISGSGSTSTVGSLSGGFMEQNIISLVVNGVGNKVFYILGGGVGVVADENGKDGVGVFTSNIYDWQIHWPGNETIVSTTKPSSDAEGHTFFIDSASGSERWVFGGIKGLTTLANSDLSKILFAEGMTLSVLDMENGKITNLSINTLPEKCVWSKNNTTVYCGVPSEPASGPMPDYWYQGVESFDDSILRIDTESGGVETMFNSGDNNIFIDVTNIDIDDQEIMLVFIDKKTLTPWYFDITEDQNFEDKLLSDDDEPAVEE